MRWLYFDSSVRRFKRLNGKGFKWYHSEWWVVSTLINCWKVGVLNGDGLISRYFNQLFSCSLLWSFHLNFSTLFFLDLCFFICLLLLFCPLNLYSYSMNWIQLNESDSIFDCKEYLVSPIFFSFKDRFFISNGSLNPEL